MRHPEAHINPARSADGYQNINDSWWRLLERALKLRGLGNVRVIGLGLRGWSIVDEAREIQSFLKREKPDLIVWGISGNDFAADPKSFQKLLVVPRWLYFVPLEMAFSAYFPNCYVVLDNWRSDIASALLANERNGFPYFQWEERLLDIEANKTAALDSVRKVNAICKSAKTKVIVALLPFRPDKNSERRLYNPAQKLLEQAGIQVCPSHGRLNQEWPPHTTKYKVSDIVVNARISTSISPANAHPSAQVSEICTNAIADQIKNGEPQLFSKEKIKTEVIINDLLPALAIVKYDRKQITFKLARNAETLTMPLGAAHLLLGLDMPAQLSSIQLSGDELLSAFCYVELIEPSRIASDNTLKNMGLREGTREIWNTADAIGKSRINAIRIQPHFKNGSAREVQLTVKLE